MKKPVLVLGVGNILYGDDGIGVEIVKALSKVDDQSVEFLDAGVSGYGIIDYFEGRKRIIIIDAVNMGGTAGKCRSFAPDDVSLAEKLKPVSLHDINILEVINLAKSLYELPQISFIGVQPARVAPGTGLSQELISKFSDIVEFARSVIAGISMKR